MESETLLEQYKRCTKINQDQLKQAKNLEDLVSIKIKAIDRSLVNRDNTYNFHYDPVVFRQQVPCMGDRDFLINQAILLKGSQRTKVNYQPPMSATSSAFNVQQEIFHENDLTNLKRDMACNIAHAGLDIIKSKDPLYKSEMQKLGLDEMRAKNNGQTNDDPLVVLKQLFKSKEYGGKILDKNHIANKYRQKYLEDMKKEQKRQHAILLRQQKLYKEDEELPMIQQQPSSNSNKNKNEDYRVPPPVERQQPRYATSLPPPSIDYTEQYQVQPPFFIQNVQQYQPPQNEVSYNDHLMQQLPREDSLSGQVPQKDTMIGINTTTNHLKNRLESLRRMFDEDETTQVRNQEGYFCHIPNAQHANNMPHFDYEHQRISRDTNNDSKKERRAFQSQDMSMYPSETEVGQEKEDLRHFLQNKIQEIKDKITANEEVLESSLHLKPRQSKYKASQLHGIQAIKSIGDSQKLEEQFNNRVNKTGVDFNFKNALLSQDKKATKQLASTVNKFNEVYQKMLTQKTGFHTQDSMNLASTPMSPPQISINESITYEPLLPREHRLEPQPEGFIHQADPMGQFQQYQQIVIQQQQAAQSLPTSARNQSAPSQSKFRKHHAPKAGEKGYKSAKDKNIVFAQMMKIEKMERDIEKKNKELRSEIKNKDIEQIIQKTKQQIKQEEEQLEVQQHQQRYYEETNSNANAQNFDLNKIYFDQEEIENMIQQTDANKEIIQSMNQYPQAQQPALSFKEEKEEASNDRESRNQQEPSQSQTHDSRGSHASVLRLQPFTPNTTNKPIHIIQSPPTDLMLSTSSKVEVTGSQNSGVDIRSSLPKNALPPQTADSWNDYQRMGSFTDSETVMPKQRHVPLKQKMKMLKTSLYEIREEGGNAYRSSSPQASMNGLNETMRQPFSSKRFNRYPRFTIFLKKSPDGIPQSKYAMENTISLNPQFLSYLQESHASMGDSIENQQFLEEQQKEQGIIITSEKNKDLTKFDPFEKVILIKGIDNSILTSFRTLKKHNNIVSDTLKVIHNKFQPFLNKHQFFVEMSKQQAAKLPYPLTDDEDTVHLAASKILAQNINLDEAISKVSPQSPLYQQNLDTKNSSPQQKQQHLMANTGYPTLQQLGYSIMIGDMQVNIDPMIDTERRNDGLPQNVHSANNANKHIHETFHDTKNSAVRTQEKFGRKKLSTTQVMTAGGTGGGIRQNAKVIKSKNAVKLAVWSGYSSKSPRRNDDGISDLAKMISQGQIEQGKESFNVKKFTDHLESQLDSIEGDPSLIIDQSQNATTVNHGPGTGQAILISHQHEIEASSPRTALPGQQPTTMNVTQESLENTSKGVINKFKNRPQEIKVQTMYKRTLKIDDAVQSGAEDGKKASTRYKQNDKPLYKVAKIDPINNAFPESIQSSSNMNSSNLTTSILPPQGQAPVVTAVIKHQQKSPAEANDDSLDQPARAGIVSPLQNLRAVELVSSATTDARKKDQAQSSGSPVISPGRKAQQDPNIKKSETVISTTKANLRMSFAGGFMMESQQMKQQTMAQTAANSWGSRTLNKDIATNQSQKLQASKAEPQILLPPLLNNNANSLVQQYKEVLHRNEQEMSPLNSKHNIKNRNALPVAKQSKIKQVIDELYQKDKRYVKQYIREDLIHPQNMIFNLDRCYQLQTATGVEKPIKMKSVTNRVNQAKDQPSGRLGTGMHQMVFQEDQIEGNDKSARLSEANGMKQTRSKFHNQTTASFKF